MHFIKKNFIDNEVISCQICNEQFYSNKEKIPIVLNCGHTLCKECLNNILKKGREKCPIDNNTEIKIEKNHLIENIIIKKTIELLSMKIDIKSLSKLDFYYCFNCDIFLSSISINVHKAINHNINTIDSYSIKWFDYIYQNINKRFISNMIKMFIILYFFQSPYLLKKQKINIIETKRYNKDKFILFGEKIEKNQSNDKLYSILMSVLSDNNSDNLIIKKGILKGNNFQLIQGYFLIKENVTKIFKSLCVLNFENNIFFGIIKFNNYPLVSGFNLDIGILNDNKDYYFGKFNDTKEFPNFELENGERIYFEDNIIKVKKTTLNGNYNDYLNNNEYFTVQNAGKDLKKISFNNIMLNCDLNPKIDILVKNNTFNIKSLEITYKEENNIDNINNNIIISKKDINENQDEIYIYQTKIYFDKYGVTLFFNIENNTFIITPIDKKECFCYLFNPTEDITTIRFLNLNELIFDIKHFINSIEKIFNYNLTLCHVYYQKMNPYEFIQIGTNYIKIETFDNKILCGQVLKLKKEYQCNDMVNMNIRELLPSFNDCDAFRDFKFKKEINTFLGNDKTNGNACKCIIF